MAAKLTLKKWRGGGRKSHLYNCMYAPRGGVKKCTRATRVEGVFKYLTFFAYIIYGWPFSGYPEGRFEFLIFPVKDCLI